jgi:hypothetical protein
MAGIERAEDGSDEPKHYHICCAASSSIEPCRFRRLRRVAQSCRMRAVTGGTTTVANELCACISKREALSVAAGLALHPSHINGIAVSPSHGNSGGKGGSTASRVPGVRRSFAFWSSDTICSSVILIPDRTTADCEIEFRPRGQQSNHLSGSLASGSLEVAAGFVRMTWKWTNRNLTCRCTSRGPCSEARDG